MNKNIVQLEKLNEKLGSYENGGCENCDYIEKLVEIEERIRDKEEKARKTSSMPSMDIFYFTTKVKAVG